MRKQIMSFLLVAFLGSITTYAAGPIIKNMGESKYCVQVGNVSMTIDAAAGAKILSYKYNDSEIISQSPMRDCLLYTSDAADDPPCVALCGRRILKQTNLL